MKLHGLALGLWLAGCATERDRFCAMTPRPTQESAWTGPRCAVDGDCRNGSCIAVGDVANTGTVKLCMRAGCAGIEGAPAEGASTWCRPADEAGSSTAAYPFSVCRDPGPGCSLGYECEVLATTTGTAGTVRTGVCRPSVCGS